MINPIWMIFLVTQTVLIESHQEILCAGQKTCGDCLKSSQCVWCSTTFLEDSFARCATRETFLEQGDTWCTTSDVLDYGNLMNVIENRPLSMVKDKDPVQLQPQRIQLRLRRDEEHRITLRYTQAIDYPVDLYYLMDLSASMERHRNSLSVLGLKLAEAMKTLTSNFRLGFGSFVDKVILPMTSTQLDKLKSPCTLSTGKPCAPPYSYKNQMPLTGNISLFQTRVQEAPVSGNLDSPEGGLDAIMQVIVCTKQIGWREKARHLIVFSTDASFHLAGDGKLAGIIEPNDSLCHLDPNGFYTHSLIQDYPSISQIKEKAWEHSMNIIFAVTNDKHLIYEMLSGNIKGSSTGSIYNDSKNVVALVSREYEKLVHTISMTNTGPETIDVKYFSKCLNDSEIEERNECGGVRLGDVIEFEIVFKLIECPNDPKDWNRTMQIKPNGINESLTIELELICDCFCERPNHPNYQRESEKCNKRGTLICGICTCDQGFYGKQCECKGDNENDDLINCRPTNGTIELCNDRGICKCGSCDCFKRPNPQEHFYGNYCECDNFSCKRSEGQVCGGRGKCECGTCNCFPGWSGETCDCKTTNTGCVASMKNSEICSGRGDCICGVCHCYDKDNIRYSGQFCQDCPTCPSQGCEELKDCVECVAYETGHLASDGKCETCQNDINVVDAIEEIPMDKESRLCRIPVDGNCTITFKYYKSDTGNLKIEAERMKICPSTKFNVFGVALGVITSTVILGIFIIMIWKAITTVKDRREFSKFEKERVSLKWNREQNPLYKQATTVFKNPTFNDNNSSSFE